MVDYDAHRWRDHFLDIRGSMVREILYRVLSCVLFSIVVTLIDRGYAPIGISDKAHGLIGVALGLLLVFRTNAAYDRFWEGRKLWGSMVNTCRNLARAATVLVAQDQALLQRLVRLLIAFPFAVMLRLRDQAPDQPGSPLRERLPPEDADVVPRADHPALAIAVRLSTCLKQAAGAGHLDSYQQMTLDQNVQLLVDHLGACERIHRTPIPFAYVVHLRRALILYCFSLPLALLPSFGWGTIPVTLVISYILFGIEEIGVEISDPFGTDDNDLPLEQICATIESNLRALQRG